MKPSKPRLIGLTGGIACGKSALSRALRQAGAMVIDGDEISRGLTAPGGSALPAIRETFGEGVFTGDTLDRKALSAIVFSDAQALRRLNRIVHPLVFREIERRIIQSAAEPALVVDLPLLYETGFETRCDTVWCAWAPPRAQLERLLDRGHTRQEALQRMQSQMPAMEKALRADRVIITTGPRAENARAVVRLWEAAIGGNLV